MKTQTNRIPNDIILRCAEAAWCAVQDHFNPGKCQLGGYNFEALTTRTRATVVKDVKAVLYGNRTPSQLHEAWAQRKMRTFDYDVCAERYPDALTVFGVLSKNDQEAYNVFWRTVKDTYSRLTQARSAVKESTRTIEVPEAYYLECFQQFDTQRKLYNVASRGYYSDAIGYRGLIAYFDSVRDFDEFKRLLAKAKEGK